MSAPTTHPSTRFRLPDSLQATEPPEDRGLARDGVRLLVAAGREPIAHARFADLGRFLRPGDLLVVNTSATRAAALEGRHPLLGPVLVHLATRLDDGAWVVELRSWPRADRPVLDLTFGDRIQLPDGLSFRLDRPHLDQPHLDQPHLDQPHLDRPQLDLTAQARPPIRLWRTDVVPDGVLERVIAAHGRPIRYGYLAGDWPLSAYQTVFAEQPDQVHSEPSAASAEMPSAGRPFSTALVTRLVSQGVLIAPIALHAGVSSLETHEPPPAERFAVPARTASLVNWTRRSAGRVIAVGTTVTRALESVVDAGGTVRPGAGWTDLVLGPGHPARVVDGLISGLHDPEASHLLLLEAVAGAELVQRVYDSALSSGYLWHEFGDSCLLLPGSARSGKVLEGSTGRAPIHSLSEP